MRILMLTSTFSLNDAHGGLCPDLAEAIVEKGHTVDVLFLDWNAEGTVRLHRRHEDRMRILVCPAFRGVPSFLPTMARRILKWGFASLFALRPARAAFGEGSYDLMIGFSPAVIYFWLARFFRKRSRRAFLALWDFFPFSHEDNNLLPRFWPLHRALTWMERRALAFYERIGFLSPANVRYFEEKYPGFRIKQEILPLWGAPVSAPLPSRDASRAVFDIGEKQVVCVFGGQLIPGRSIDRLLALAEKAYAQNGALLFLFAGSGPLLGDVLDKSKACKGIRYVGKLDRSAYMGLLAAADIGVVFTQPDVSVCPFPSKTIDYFRARLPILGAVDRHGDYASIIEHTIKAGLACAADDEDRVLGNLLRLAGDAALRRTCGENGFAYFSENMTAGKVADQILRA
ncbi:MAG: glycosyltransferase family 4 protein [Alphaproteobacteria bacterium]|nr:glycosyltransferase family 4 protein [Alphaproteobacteria bacterium]